MISNHATLTSLLLVPATSNMRVLVNSNDQKYLIQFLSYFYAQYSIDYTIYQYPENLPNSSDKLVIFQDLDRLSHDQQLSLLSQIHQLDKVIAVSTFSIHTGLLQAFDIVISPDYLLFPNPISIFNSKTTPLVNEKVDIFIDPKLRTFVFYIQNQLKAIHFTFKNVLIEGCSMDFDETVFKIIQILAASEGRKYALPKDAKAAIIMSVGSKFMVQIIYKANGDEQKWGIEDIEKIVNSVIDRFDKW